MTILFTGLIEEIGTLRAVKRQGEAMVLEIGASSILSDVKIGDSISVNGVCLTVISHERSGFAVDVMPQTYRYTNLHELRPGSPVNLERAMAAGGRFGGHIVQGHIDGTAVIGDRTPEANAVYFTIEPNEAQLMRMIVPQGSVTIDGISLTVADVDRERGAFTVSIIPHTLRQTVLQHKRAGDTVNVENDILGKYIEHLLGLRGRAAESELSEAGGRRSGLTESMLRDNGFMV